MAEIKFEIKEKEGMISESAKGWTKELNLSKLSRYVYSQKIYYKHVS